MTFRRPVHAGLALLAAAVLGAAGCGRRAARPPAPAPVVRAGTTETGIASWYGFPYHGRLAASGEVYDMERLTAAHRSLPFDTRVEVTNLSNGKRVEVRINDRGPFVKGRIIDLSQAAARDIGMLTAGTARVQLRVLAQSGREPRTEALAKPAAPVPWYTVQAGAFAGRSRADALGAAMISAFSDARVIQGNETPPLWHVLVGRQMTLEQATDLAERVRREAGEAVVVPERPSPQLGE